ncbi:MAG: hypothetical protein LBV57_03810 [Candidatus Symbiothrix sp.]|jgi:beta-glucosidase|nr:hypothetical protein [Candidatus Symbiothrix sp.]
MTPNDKMKLIREGFGDETVATGSIQAWSPVLDVTQDARRRRCEETFGEDPVLVSLIEGVDQRLSIERTSDYPKHFAVHGIPLDGYFHTDALSIVLA